MNIAWVSFRELPDGLEDEWPAIAALTDHGHTVTPVVWNQKNTDSFSVWLVRTPWDYHLTADLFFNWLNDLESSGQRVVNPPDMMRRYIDKSYENSINVQVFRLRQIFDTKDKGVEIIETQRGSGYVFTPNVHRLR